MSRIETLDLSKFLKRRKISIVGWTVLDFNNGQWTHMLYGYFSFHDLATCHISPFDVTLEM